MIPSLLQIPSAVSDSKLHSVLPNNGKGDFQFDRSTGATRVNRDGLIEEVGYFSSELVQNGNFSELGSDVVNNGSFSGSSTGWTESGTWAYGNNNEVCTGNGTNQMLTQSGILTNGKTYKYSIDIISSTLSSQNIRVYLGGTDYITHTLNGGAETISAYGQSVGSNLVIRVTSANTSGILTIDNVSVKQVDPNDRWTLVSTKFTGANTFENTATNGRIFQSFTTIVGSKYKVSVTINSGTWNVVASTTNNTSGTIQSTGNTTTSEFFEFTATGTTTFLVLYNIGASGSVASITDVSVVEVQGDRPRLSYDITNGVVEDKPHLLLEPSSTNLVTFSEQLDNSDWVKSNSSITANQIISPNGSTTADLLTSSSGTSTHSVRNDTNQTVSIGNVISLSVFAKKGTYSIIQLTAFAFGTIYANFDLDNGAVGQYTSTNASIEDYGNGWYRCSLTATAVATSNSEIQINFVESLSSIRNSSYNATGTETIYLWGAQVEVQSYATSYIPTAGTTITRAAETCDKTGLSSSIGQTEGVLYGEFNYNDNTTGTRRLICLTDGTTSNRITTYVDTNNRLSVYIVNGGSAQADIRATTLTNGIIKYAVLYANNNIKLFLNGTQVSTDTSATIPATSNLYIGSENGNNPSYFNWKGVALYTEPLSESQLMQLTGVTASSIYSDFVTRTASFTVEALNEVKKVIDNL